MVTQKSQSETGKEAFKYAAIFIYLFCLNNL